MFIKKKKLNVKKHHFLKYFKIDRLKKKKTIVIYKIETVVITLNKNIKT